MKIRETRAVEVRIYGTNILPLDILVSNAMTSAMVKNYGFSAAEPSVEKGRIDSIAFRHGVFMPSEDRQVAVSSIVIEPRKVAVTVVGSTDDVALLFDELTDAFKELRPELEPELFDPLVASVETMCVVQLGDGLAGLLSPDFRSFVDGTLTSGCASPYGEPVLTPHRLSFAVNYEADERLTDTGVTLARKELRIERRADTEPAENIFFVRAPMTTDTLVAALAELDSKFTAG